VTPHHGAMNNPNNKNDMRPLLILGCVRSGTTILHQLLMTACASAVDLTDDDFESRYYWQDLGVRIGSRATGTYCDAARYEQCTEDQVARMREYVTARSVAGTRPLITKNPHLLNKVPFVTRVLPDARFVMIIRDAMSVVASMKVGFQRANVPNEEYPPFVHYWPEGNGPCWWTVLNDEAGVGVTAGSLKRLAKQACCTLHLIKSRTLAGPGKIHPHEKLSSFLQSHPDLSRYYPGNGFRRLPEGWLALNANACRALRAIDSSRWLAVTYSELVASPRQTIARICDFGGIPPTQLSAVPDHLDESPSQKWRKNLSPQEQEVVLDHMKNGGKDDFKMLCNIFQEDLLGLQNSASGSD
jgi:hypothetical protein